MALLSRAALRSAGQNDGAKHELELRRRAAKIFLEALQPNAPVRHVQDEDIILLTNDVFSSADEVICEKKKQGQDIFRLSKVCAVLQRAQMQYCHERADVWNA